MKVEIKKELKIWVVYFGIVLLSVFIHELGHSIMSWIHGYMSVPTPAKEYALEIIPAHIQTYISLGGILGNLLFALGVFFLYLNSNFKYNSAILAGAIASPGIYTVRFILQGRGHDETEFQEAQSALGLSYSGHFLDWLFLVLFLAGILIWYFRSKPNYGILLRLALGFMLTFIFLIGLQKLNNAASLVLMVVR